MNHMSNRLLRGERENPAHEGLQSAREGDRAPLQFVTNLIGRGLSFSI